MSDTSITGLKRVNRCTVGELKQRLDAFPDAAFITIGCVEPDVLAIFDPNKNILANPLGHIMLTEPVEP
jgi:hypothetical protein